MDWYILGTAAAFLGNRSQGNISTGGEDTSRFQASLQNTPQYATLPSVPQIGAAQQAGGSQVSTKLSSASMCCCVHLGGHQKCDVAVAKRCNHTPQEIIGLWPTAGWRSPSDVTIDFSVFMGLWPTAGRWTTGAYMRARRLRRRMGGACCWGGCLRRPPAAWSSARPAPTSLTAW